MSKQKKTSIGGQALLEGIMMRGPAKTAIAVRDPDGKMIVETWDTQGNNRAKFFRLPFIRGLFNMYDSLSFGYKCLMRSAEIAGLEDEPPKKSAKNEAGKQAALVTANAQEQDAQASMAASAKDAAQGAMVQEATVAQGADAPTEKAIETEVVDVQETLGTSAQQMSEASEVSEVQQTPEEQAALAPSVQDGAATQNPEAAAAPKGKEKSESSQKAENALLMIISTVLGLALAVGLFIFLPTQIIKWLTQPLPFLEHQIWRSVFEGIIRIIIFIGYMACMLLMKDIRRTYMYHGAEHKTIFCYESGQELTVENVRPQSRFHPRCGTSFMVIVLLVGILVSMFITTANPILRTLIKLACLPIVVGIGYELIKLAGRYDNTFTRVLSAPGKALQRITTQEPDDSMIACAIASLKEVIPPDDSDKW